MTDTLAAPHTAPYPPAPSVMLAERRSYVDWPAVIAGTVVAMAMSFLLLGFGTSLGLSMISPWPGLGASATTLGWSAAIWFALVQIFSVAVGAYLAARMRPRVGDAIKDEVQFRDAVNGLLVWALGLTLGVLLALGATLSAARTGAQAVAPAVSAAATTATSAALDSTAQPAGGLRDPVLGFADAMFRSERTADGKSVEDVRMESARILANAAAQGGTISPNDRAYLVRVVAARTGSTPQDAEARVTEALDRAKAAATAAREAADKARKATAFSGFWITFVLLLSGLASVWAATLGGEHRDQGTWTSDPRRISPTRP